MTPAWRVTAHRGTVLAPTRILAAVIIPFLIIAAAILILRPDETARLFAWEIAPPVTAMLLGGVYLGGAVFFVRVLQADDWHAVSLGFPPVAAFATLLGTATILHWDRFTAGHIAFHAWAALYLTTPFLVLAAWWWNRRAAPPPTDDDALSPAARGATAAFGATAAVLSLLLFVRPEAAADVWPWALTPLTGRVIASVLALGGAGLVVALDPRRRPVGVLSEVAVVMLGLGVLALLRGWDDVDGSNPLAWVAAGGSVLLLLGSAVLRARSERTGPRAEVGVRR
jgi:hypothetical protein